jgi:hypothetical protein
MAAIAVIFQDGLNVLSKILANRIAGRDETRNQNHQREECHACQLGYRP